MNRTMFGLVAAAIIAALAFAATSMEQLPRIALSIVIGVPSFVLMIVSRRQLGKSFSVMPAAKSLVTKGLYSRILHPLYVFLDLTFIAVIVGLGWPILLWVWGCLVVVQTVQSRKEEKVLSAAFGADYEMYRNRTWF